MPSFLLSPLVKWALIGAGGAMVIHWVVKETRRINEELERAQRGRRMEGAGADFHVVGLQNDAAPIRPILLEREDEALKRARGVQIVLSHGVAGKTSGFSHRLDTDS